MTHRMRLGGLASSVALVVVACSGGSSSPASSTPSSTTDSVTSLPVETTVAGTDGPTTTAPAGPVYPLTGLPVVDPAVAARPALVVKIDNNVLARPQSGLDEADIVFEEIVEVQTRFVAVFQSQGAEPVGPIRSGRTQDIALLGSFNKPLFAWSGGNANVTAAINNSDLFSINNVNPRAQKLGGFYRSPDRKGPHNLYATTSALWSLAPAGAGPPPAQFSYLSPGDTPQGDRSAGTQGDMLGLAIAWTYDAPTHRYARTSAGVVHADALGGAVTTDNVIVMSVLYRPSPADARSPEAQTIGTGDVMVFTRGVVEQGTWTRKNRLSPFSLSDADGTVIKLSPGRTWVELASPGKFTPLS